MKQNKTKSTTAVNQSKLNRRQMNSLHQNENKHFFRCLLESLFRIDVETNRICTCQSLNRNTNAFSHENENQQLYPHMRKVYDDDTDLLDQVHIIMSTIKPECSLNEQHEESIAQRHRRHTRVSKQRAKVLITGYCSRKIADNVKIAINKRNYSSLCFPLIKRENNTDSS